LLSAKPPRPVAFLFAATLFLSAFLLFTVEPLAARVLLPTLGGAPMVWNTCVVLFQILLLAGYLYAHAATGTLSFSRHTAVYLALLTLPLAVLPFPTSVPGGPSPGDNPVLWLLLVLGALIGLPFFILSTSAAVLQTWFARADHHRARDPYFLYAASNAGSLMALVAYPAIVEPTLRLRDQSRLWAVGYAIFVAAVCICAHAVRRDARRDVTPAPASDNAVDVGDEAGSLSARRRARWVVLALVPSSLMLGVTSYLSTDVAAIPLLWVVPLGIYLLTFIIAFGARSPFFVVAADRALPLLILPLGLFMIILATVALWFAVPLHLLTFAAVSLVCHGQLAADRPRPALLTEFYVWIAVGGMLGGLFNTLAAPLLFKTVIEYPLMLVFACVWRRGVADSTPRSSSWSARSATWLVPLAIGAATAGVMAVIRSWEGNTQLVVAVASVPLFACFSQSRRPLRFALSLGAMWIAASLAIGGRGGTLHVERTFFGVYRVALEPRGRYRTLVHGTTLHGLQAVDPARQREPLSYYHRTGPFGQAFSQLRNLSARSHIAVVGLGIGSLASYATAGQRWTFYELDPAVERLANTTAYFTFLRECGDRCRVVIGDARVSLANAPANQYALIVLDAFSSDAIPTHLMTSEALTLYRSRLSSGGVLAFHISNRNLLLGPVLARLAEHHGLSAFRQFDREIDKGALDGKMPSNWVVMADSAADLGPLVADPRWQRLVASPRDPLWTDDYSSVLRVLRLW
jgi:hypothetical protein